jgi:virginiamycin B lyase
MRIAGVTCVLALAVSACGGGGGGGGSNAGTGGPPTVPVATTGTAQLAVVVPSIGSTSVIGTAAVSPGLKPFYVSAGSYAIGILLNGVAVDPSQVSKVCNVNQAGATVCTFNFPAPAGNDTFDMKLVDTNFNLLSEGTVQATITAGQTTTLHLTFLGQPARVTLQLDNPYPLRGVSSTLKLTATAFDAANYQIIGDNYLHPITISSSDTSGQTLLSGTQFTNPADSITVTYSGKRLPSATFTATSPSSASNTTAVLTPNAYAQFGPTAYTTWRVANGSDGNVWFTECSTNAGPCKIGRITPAGQIAESADVTYAQDLTAGPDGNIWFTENNRAYMGQITPAMQIHEFLIRNLLPNEAFYAGPITTGSDGNLWFAEGDKLGVMSTSGQMLREISLGGWYAPAGMVRGPDGAYWLSEGFGQIAQVTTAGGVTQRSIGSQPAAAGTIAFGSNQLLYFSYAQSVGTMTLSGAVSQLALTPTGVSFGQPFALGPDGSIWGFGFGQNQRGVASMTLNGAVTIYPFVGNLATSNVTGFNRIVWGVDGNLWAAGGNYITRLYNGP